jgi:hypothetical protein
MKKTSSSKRLQQLFNYSMLFLTLVLTSCGNQQEKFCSCLNVGEELNNYAQKILQEELSSEKVKKLAALRQSKREVCSEFETMAGAELLQLKAACEK